MAVIDMVTHMKTTIDIADGLLARAKAQAVREGTTLKNLTEEGLQLVLHERAKRKGKRVQPVTVSGGALQPEEIDADWIQIQAAAYEANAPLGYTACGVIPEPTPILDRRKSFSSILYQGVFY